MPIRRPGLFRAWDARATLEAVQQYVQTLLTGALPAHFDPGQDFDLVDEINGELAKKADLISGKVPLAQIPDAALERYLGTAASQGAMLALSGQPGDYCLRTDTNGGLGSVWFLAAADPAQLSSWVEAPVGISQAAADARYKTVEIAYQWGGRPGASEEYRYVSASAKTIPATGSTPAGRLHLGRVKTPPSANAVFNIHKTASLTPQTLGASLGTVTFGAGDRFSSIMIASPIALALGESLVLVAPASQDAALADGAVTLVGVDS